MSARAWRLVRGSFNRYTAHRFIERPAYFGREMGECGQRMYPDGPMPDDWDGRRCALCAAVESGARRSAVQR